MKLVKQVVLAALLLVGGRASAQIQVSPYAVENCVDGIDASAVSLVENKLRSMLSQNGALSRFGESRFVLTAHFIVTGKEALSTTPVKVVSRMSATLAIGDGVDGTCYGSRELEITGVGRNDNEAAMNAIRSLNGKSEQVGALIQVATKRIVEYYEAVGPKILASARAQAKGGKYDEAIYMLAQIPEASSSYQQAQTLMGNVMQQKVDHESATYLNEATAQWSAAPTSDNAPNVVATLSKIDPNAACYPQAKALMRKIESQAKLEQTREYNLKTKAITSAVQLQKARIRAAENIAVAYARSQPKTVYRVYGWW